MKTVKILSILGIFLGTFMILTSSTLLLLNKNSQKDIPISEQSYESANISQLKEEEVMAEETKSEKPVISELGESGWIPNWGFDLGYESLQNNKGIIDTVNPVLYTINSSGNITSRGVSENSIKNLMTYSKENDIRVIPTVGSYDFNSMKNSLTNESISQKNITTLLTEITKYGFDGIDLDYEMINTTEKDNYLEFLRNLEKELVKRDKILSVTVFPQWNNATYTNNQDTRFVQDYSEIGEIADEVKIMAYDYTLQSSSIPGPIAPISWVKQILDYATKVIPKEKIWLGVPLYGYEWIDGKTVALTYTSIKSIVSNPNINSTFREDLGEVYSEFGCENGQRCVMYYQNEESIQIRRDIAKEYGIAGVSYWRLGGEMDILK